MVPTLILLGVLGGHWWRWTVPALSLGWPLLLLATGTPLTAGEVVIAIVLGLVNVGLGAVAYTVIRSVVRGRRRGVDAPVRRPG